MINARQLIQKFDMEPHPEGGFYKRTFLADADRFSSILFLLLENNFSAFHKIKSDEQWNWYEGDAIVIHEINKEGNYTKTILSNDDANINFQHVVKGGNWFASESIGEKGFALCGCTVIPAFNFDDFELGKQSELLQFFPQHSDIIERLTRLS